MFRVTNHYQFFGRDYFFGCGIFVFEVVVIELLKKLNKICRVWLEYCNLDIGLEFWNFGIWNIAIFGIAIFGYWVRILRFGYWFFGISRFGYWVRILDRRVWLSDNARKLKKTLGRTEKLRGIFLFGLFGKFFY